METNPECLFCQIAQDKQDAEIVRESEKTVSLLDVNPSSLGHTMVIPKFHKASIRDLNKDELTIIFDEVRKTEKQIDQALNPDGFTIGINQGEAGGQRVPHLQIHIIPRFEGDQGGPIQAVVRNPPEKDISAIAGKIRGENSDINVDQFMQKQEEEKKRLEEIRKKKEQMKKQKTKEEEDGDEEDDKSLEEELLELEEEELEDLKKIMKKLKIPD
ncbi:MAG: HIT family protein [Candidatus Aenigmatarchaeota archaeon]